MVDPDKLWQQLESFEFDDPHAHLTFTQRLAREHQWTVGYANSVVDEYRRFLFLAATAKQEITPSEQVDAAWHLHMVYTSSYWDELCGTILKQPLHHGPTRGGHHDGARFEQQYRDTLASYQRAFGHCAPQNIWPPPAERFDRTTLGVTVDRKRYWIVPKPWHWLRMPKLRACRSATPVLTVVPLLALANPLDMRGPEFLQLFVTLMVVGVAAALVLRYLLRGAQDDSRQALDEYQTAYLAAGVEGTVRAGVAALVDQKVLEVGRASGKVSNDYRIAVRNCIPADSCELEQRIVAACGEPGGVHFARVIEYAKPAAEKIGYRLEAWGLIVPRSGVHSSQWIPVVAMLLTTSIGWAKLVVGVERNKPVGFLVAMLVVSTIIAALFFMRPHRTRAGDQLLSKLRQQHARLPRSCASGESLSATDIALMAGLFGMGGLVGSELAPLNEAWKYRKGPSSDGGGVANIAGCGGDGGGGGCGGGCGGCGG